MLYNEKILQEKVKSKFYNSSIIHIRACINSGLFRVREVELKPEYPVKRVVLSNKKHMEKPEQMLTLESCEVIVLELIMDEKSE